MDTNSEMAIEQRLQRSDQSVCLNSTQEHSCAYTTTSNNSHQKLCCALHSNRDSHSHEETSMAPSLHSGIMGVSVRRLCAVLLLFMLFSATHACGPGRGIGGPRRNRKLTPLVFKQNVPNMYERALGAAGPNEGVIKRDSPRFKNLVLNYNKDIFFKDDEGSGADRLMSRRCKEKLNILAVSVMNQWPGVRLRVIESWDEDNNHNANSLHYEGRAVDITTNDRDSAKYGMLARLAVEAGFDWVYYQSRQHIHCSVKSDSSHVSHMSGCFTADSTVLTADGVRKSMRDVAIGDRVLSMSSTGEPIFSEVILFMDRNLEQLQNFVQIHTESGATLTVTPSHLVLVWNPEKALLDYVFADRVEEDAFVVVHTDSQQLLRPQRVVKVSAVQRKGVVAPLTREGTIVVNSVAASCYAIVNSQRLAHWGMAPMRLLATLKSWWPSGCSSKLVGGQAVGGKVALTAKVLGKSNVNVNSTQDATAAQYNGVHWYAQLLYTLKDYVVPQSWRYQ